MLKYFFTYQQRVTNVISCAILTQIHKYKRVIRRITPIIALACVSRAYKVIENQTECFTS